MKLSIEQIQERIQYIRKQVDEYNTKERASALHKMYDHFEERMMLAPGSSIDFYHNAWPGGYVDHIMNITEAGKKLYKVYEDFGMKMTYGVEEVVFCTLKGGERVNGYFGWGCLNIFALLTQAETKNILTSITLLN